MDWNERYQKLDTPWEKGAATPVLPEIRGRHPGLFTGDAVAPGCGTGHDARWLAAQGCRVTGLDIAPLAIEQAVERDPDASVTFRVADFLNPPADCLSSFDLLWEHTCLCALEPSLRPAYFRSAAAVLKPGGRVVGVFFIDPEMDEGESGPPFGIAVDELSRAWDEAGFRVRDTWVPVTGFEGRVGRERVMVLDRV